MADTAWVRGAPLPAWARLTDAPPAPAELQRLAVVVRLADTQLWAGPQPSYLVHRVEQVNDAGALGQIGQIAVSFNPHYQRLLLHRLRIVRSDETVDHLPTVPLQLLQRESGLEQGVVSGSVTATVVLPDVRVGDTLELAYTVEGENPIFGDRYAGWSGWDQSHFVLRRRVALVAPLQRRIHWQWVGDRPGPRPQPQEAVDGDCRRLQWDGDHLPGVPFEPYLPRDAQPLRWLQFTEFDDWNQVARWALALFPLDEPLPEELQPWLAQWRALAEPEAQVSQALQWVQREIRYYSVSLGESSHRPHSPSEVVQRRYGDCKDKSLLLAQILRALGIEAWPALAASRTRRLPLKLLPSPEAFDHVIVQVRLPQRGSAPDRWAHLDATRLPQPGALDRIGQGMEDAAVLVVAPHTTGLTPVHSPHGAQLFGNELFERYTVERFDGAAVLESEQHWHGLGAESLRAMLSRMSEAELSQWALSRYDRRHPGAQLLGAPELHHDVDANRLSVRARYAVTHAVKEERGRWSLAWTAANLQGAFVLPESLNRSLPLAVPSFPGRLHYEVEVRWPQPVHAPAGDDERLDTPHLQLHSRTRHEGRVTQRCVTLQPRVPEVPADALQQLVRDLRRLDGLLHGSCIASLQLDTPELHHRLARHWHLQIERAGALLAQQHRPDDERRAALCLRSQAHLDLGEPLAALHDAEAALRLPVDPRWRTGSTARVARGKALWALGRFDEAEAEFAAARDALTRHDEGALQVPARPSP